jgi:deazaflavin-dependent oxidoreductase (nitroreductase family)
MVNTVAYPPVTGDAGRMTTDRYLQPGWFTRNVFNRLVVMATRAGLSVWGSRILQVPGRTSGQIRQTPVNLLTFDGGSFLVAPRGVTQWVRNLRAAQEGTLRLGRHGEAFRAVEIADDDKVSILRAYLKRWKTEVGVFFDGVGPEADDAELLRIAPNHPVFRIDSNHG